jgi:chromosome segregation ATPase
MPVMNLRLKMQRFNISRPILGGAATNVKEHVVPETEGYTLDTEQDVNTIVKQIVDTVGVDPIIEFVNGYLNAGLIKSEDRDLLYATVKQLQESCNTHRVESQSALDELRTYLLSCNKNSLGCTVLGAIRMLIKLHSEDKGKWMADLKAGLELRDKVIALEKNVVEVESLQRKTPAVQDEISALKTRITELQDLNKHLMEQRDKYQATIDEHVRASAAQKMRLGQLDKNIVEYRKHVDELNKALLDKTMVHRESLTNIEKLDKQIVQLKAVVEQQECDITTKTARITTLEKDLDSKEKEYKELSALYDSDMASAKKRLTEFVEQRKELEKEIERLKAEVAKLTAECLTFSTENSALKSVDWRTAYDKGKISNAIGNIHLALDVLKELTTK